MALTQVQPGMLTGNNPAIPTSVGVGTQALNSNSGANNTAVGYQALRSNTTAVFSTAVGYQAGYAATASYNTMFGAGAGSGASFTGNENTLVGYYAGNALTSGSKNTFVGPAFGNGAGGLMTTGGSNTIIGGYSGNAGGIDIRTSSNNIVLSDGDGNVRYRYESSYGMSVFGTSGKLPNDSSSANTFVVGLPSAWPGTVETTCGSYTSNYDHYNYRNGNGIVGSIRTNGSGTSYLTSSDYRLKENVAPMTGALDKVAQLNPCTYTWKVDGSIGQGFIAHELAEVCPDAVSGEKDQVNADGSIKPQGIDTSFLVATLTAAIQEQQAIITDLKARIETLEAK
jgi:hypothetical protein